MVEQAIGSLDPGKRADLAVFDVDSVPTLVREGAGTCMATVAGGTVRWMA